MDMFFYSEVIDVFVAIDELGGCGLSDFELDILLLAGYKYGNMISLAQTSKAKRIIAPAYFQTFFAK